MEDLYFKKHGHEPDDFEAQINCTICQAEFLKKMEQTESIGAEFPEDDDILTEEEEF